MADRKLSTNRDSDDEKREFEEAAKKETGGESATYKGVDEQTLKTYVEVDGKDVVMDVDPYNEPHVIKSDDDW